jgi:hypothetical protein
LFYVSYGLALLTDGFPGLVLAGYPGGVRAQRVLVQDGCSNDIVQGAAGGDRSQNT